MFFDNFQFAFKYILQKISCSIKFSVTALICKKKWGKKKRKAVSTSFVHKHIFLCESFSFNSFKFLTVCSCILGHFAHFTFKQ